MPGERIPTDTYRPRGYTPSELGRLLRVNPDRVRGWIRRGELAAVNTARPAARPRFVVLPDQLAAFIEKRQAASPPVRPKPGRQKCTGKVDYFP